MANITRVLQIMEQDPMGKLYLENAFLKAELEEERGRNEKQDSKEEEDDPEKEDEKEKEE